MVPFFLVLLLIVIFATAVKLHDDFDCDYITFHEFSDIDFSDMDSCSHQVEDNDEENIQGPYLEEWEIDV